MEETGKKDKRAEDRSKTGSPQSEVLLESCCLPDQKFWLDGHVGLYDKYSPGSLDVIVASIKDINKSPGDDSKIL